MDFRSYRFQTPDDSVFAVITVAMSLRPANAIEMFTFFGDGSRVPLPSLETPIEAYPGIPLRSDRLRARRQARYQVPPPTGMPVGNGRITIQAMPNSGTSPNLDDGMSSAPAPETIRTPPNTDSPYSVATTLTEKTSA